MEEEKTSLRLDIDVQKLESEKLRKENNKAGEELVQADMLSVKYELDLDQGQKLAVLLRKIRMLSNRAKLYL
ncbi:hypothetical protein Gotur_025996 [Gossypium turneri]